MTQTLKSSPADQYLPRGAPEATIALACDPMFLTQRVEADLGDCLFAY
jgi:hypothetical protein